MPGRLQLASLRALVCVALLLALRAHAQAPQPAADDGNWPMAGRDYANTRYSPLAQVDAGNVASLKLAFTFSTGVLRGHEAAPVVVNGTMYVITP
jgi:glucose dehydrogenase